MRHVLLADYEFVKAGDEWYSDGRWKPVDNSMPMCHLPKRPGKVVRRAFVTLEDVEEKCEAVVDRKLTDDERHILGEAYYDLATRDCVSTCPECGELVLYDEYSDSDKWLCRGCNRSW